VAVPHPFNETYSLSREELGNTSSSPRTSVIPMPELFTYALYIVIAFVLEVIYLTITLLLVFLSISCWCIGEPSLFRFCVLGKINASLILLLFKPFVKFNIAYSNPPPLGDICVLSHAPAQEHRPAPRS
jgi:hypothetical protein